MTEKINGYDDLTDIGGGGFSRVYSARDLKHDRTVAIKVLDSRGASDSERRAFARELKAMGRIGDHPHAVTVPESGFTADDRPFLVMPFYKSGTFADRLRRTGQQPIHDVLDLGVKMASALETIHRLGYLHRDVKPENIFVDDFGNHALGDFGISSITDGNATRTGGVALTPAHAAPEVWEDEKPTALTDIYSLGSTLYNLLAGRPPFTADSHTALLRKVLRQEPPRLSRDDVPYELWKLLQQMLAKTPSERPDSALSVAVLLRDLQQRQGLPQTAITVQGWVGNDSNAPDSTLTTDHGVQPAVPDNENTVVREVIAQPRPKADTEVTGQRPSPTNSPTTTPNVEPPADRESETETPTANTTEVRSPLQRPTRTRPTDDEALSATSQGEQESGAPRRFAMVAGAIVLLIAVGAIVTLLSGGTNETDPAADPADDATQDVDPDDLGPVLIAGDPVDFRIETSAGELFARWEGPTNPNVVYEVMTNGIEATVEVPDTEVNLADVGLLVEGAPSCVSVRVTTVSPARVGEWVGPECAGP